MKAVPLYEFPSGIKSVGVLRQVLEVAPPQRGVNVGDMRARCRVLDLLDKVPDGGAVLVLEDADHATLVRAVNEMQWAVANPSLLKIIDGILEAKEPAKDDAAA